MASIYRPGHGVDSDEAYPLLSFGSLKATSLEGQVNELCLKFRSLADEMDWELFDGLALKELLIGLLKDQPTQETNPLILTELDGNHSHLSSAFKIWNLHINGTFRRSKSTPINMQLCLDKKREYLGLEITGINASNHFMRVQTAEVEDELRSNPGWLLRIEMQRMCAVLIEDGKLEENYADKPFIPERFGFRSLDALYELAEVSTKPEEEDLETVSTTFKEAFELIWNGGEVV